jgi:hypothetical protein
MHHKTKFVTSVTNNILRSRFKILLFLFRLGGFPLKMQSTSRIQTVYNVVFTVCFYFTAVCMCMDTYVHRSDLVYAMKKLRIFIGMILAAWIHISFRYALLGPTTFLQYNVARSSYIWSYITTYLNVHRNCTDINLFVNVLLEAQILWCKNIK